MKIKFLVILLCLTGYVFGQTKETVHSIVVVRHDKSWYETQLKLWKAEVAKDDQNAEAWYNYYSAVRAIRNISHFETEDRKKFEKMGHEVADAAYKAIPESFEANHIKYWDGLTLKAQIKYLNKAYEIAPNDPRILDDMMIQAEMSRNKERFHEVAVKVYEKQSLPGAMLNWAYNVLSEVEENSILFSGGDNDTYALWLMQEALGYRKDVQVINTYMVRDQDYRNKLLAELGLESFDMKEEEPKFRQMYHHFLDNDKGIPVYISTSTIGMFKKWENTMNDLYLTGLAYLYCKKSFDNVSLIRRNYENRYLKDHLYMNFSYHIANERAINFKGMYLPMLLKLVKHYEVCEEYAKSKELVELIKNIAKEIDKEDEIKDYLKELKSGC